MYRRYLKLFATVCFVMAMIFFARGIFLTTVTLDRMNSSVQAEGTVVSVIPGERFPGRSNDLIYVQFQTEDGRDIEFGSRTFTMWGKFHEGETVRVFYHPETPDNAMIDSAYNNWSLPSMAFVASCFFLIFVVRPQFLISSDSE